jgi:hypothetical protein
MRHRVGDVARQQVDAFIGGPKRTRPALAVEVRAEGLLRTSLGAFQNRFRQRRFVVVLSVVTGTTRPGLVSRTVSTTNCGTSAISASCPWPITRVRITFEMPTQWPSISALKR